MHFSNRRRGHGASLGPICHRSPRYSATVLALSCALFALVDLSPRNSLAERIASYQNDGGAYYVFSQELIAYLEAEGPDGFALENLETQGSVENIQRLYGDPDVVLALCQEDVTHFFYTGSNNDFFFVDRSADTKIAALGRLLLEEVYLVSNSEIQTIDDIERLHVGEPRSGTFATYSSLRRYHTPQWEEIQSGDRLEMFRRGEIDAFVDVASTPNMELLTFGAERDDLKMLSIERDDLALGLDIYRSRVIPDSLSPDGSAFRTVSVPAILLARRDLPRDVSQAILRVFYDERVRRQYFPRSLPYFEALPSELRASDGTPLGSDVRFTNLPIPPHPSVVRLTLGRFPYLGFAVAILISALVWIVWILLPRRSLRARQTLLGTPSHRLLYRDVNFIMFVFTWVFAVAWVIKALEIGELVSGRALSGTNFVHMSVGDVLQWLVVICTIGYEDASFPISPLAKIAAVSVQILGFAILTWVGARVVSFLVGKLLEKRDMQSFSSISNHVLVFNWNLHGPRLLEELRNNEIPEAKRKRRILIVVKDPDTPVPTNDFHDVDHVNSDAWDRLALSRVAPERADSIIILSPGTCDSDSDTCDGLVYRTALSLRTYLEDNVPTEARPHVVAQVARPIDQVARETLGIDEVVSSHDMGGRLLAQTVTCPGITRFFDEILSVDGESNEIYQCPVPHKLVGSKACFWSIVEYYAANARSGEPVLPVGIRLAPRPVQFERGTTGEISKPAVLLNPTITELCDHHADEFIEDDVVLFLADEPRAATGIGS